MSAAQSGGPGEWKKLFEHVPHAATAIALEQLIEFLLSAHATDFAEVRKEIQDRKWAPFRQAELNLQVLKEIQNDANHSKEREKELLEEAYQCYRQSAAMLHDEQRCKVLISAEVCAQYLELHAEANALRKIAREELRKTNDDLFKAYNRRVNVLKRAIHANVKVSRSELGIVTAGLFIAAFAFPPCMGAALTAGTVLCTSSAAGKLTDDHEHIAERLRATQQCGEEIFGGKWHGPRAGRRGIWNFASQPAA